MTLLCSAQVLEKLVGYDTTSYKSNLELIHYVQHFLQELNLASELVFDATGKKANLYTTIGPPDRAGVMLSGHTDVVPVTDQEWSTDPFCLTLEDARYIGRGTADMKGFIASALAACQTTVAARLQTPIHLAFSYDEEVGCLGVRRLIDMLGDLPVRPAMAIVGEPTQMKVVTGHKGKTAFNVHVTGKAGHSAYTSEAVNAVEYAARLISYINDAHRQRALHGPFDDGYRVPHTTLHVGTIAGGSALNIVPHACEFQFEIRHIPTDKPDQLIAGIQHKAEQMQTEMQKSAADSSIVITQKTAYPGLTTDPAHQAVAFVQQLLIEDSPPDSPQNWKTHKVSFGTEGGLFSESLNIPTVVCGPGNIAQAHKPGEYLAKSQLALCDRMMSRLLTRCESPL